MENLHKQQLQNIYAQIEIAKNNLQTLLEVADVRELPKLYTDLYLINKRILTVINKTEKP